LLTDRLADPDWLDLRVTHTDRDTTAPCDLGLAPADGLTTAGGWVR
jgi:hypothetical protein